MKDIGEIVQKRQAQLYLPSGLYMMFFITIVILLCKNGNSRHKSRVSMNCPIICAELCAPLDRALKLFVLIAKATEPRRTAPANNRIGQYRGGS